MVTSMDMIYYLIQELQLFSITTFSSSKRTLILEMENLIASWLDNNLISSGFLILFSIFDIQKLFGDLSVLIIHSYHSSCNIQYNTKINIAFFNFLVSVHILKIYLQTLDMKSQSREHPFNSSVQENYMVLEENVKNTESEAVIKYDFNKPKQYIIYNENERNPRNNQSRGMLKRLMCLTYRINWYI